MHELAGGDGLQWTDLAAFLFHPIQRKHGIRQGRQRCAHLHAHCLARLQTDRAQGTGGHVADDRQGFLYTAGVLYGRGIFWVAVGVAAPGNCQRLADVHAAHGIAVDGGLVESGQRFGALDSFGAAQPQGLGDGDAHWLGGHRRRGDDCQLFFDRSHVCCP